MRASRGGATPALKSELPVGEQRGNDIERMLSNLHAAIDRSPGDLASGAIAHCDTLKP
jgi:hypothetical protein